MHEVRRWLRYNTSWLRFEVALAAAVAAAFLVYLPLRPAAEEELLAELSTRIAGTLEQASPAEHHDHGHDIAAGEKVVCVAEAFGHDPADAHRLADVQWAYAYFLCAAAPPGTPWEQAARVSGPVAISLTVPPIVRTAQAGLGYQDRVRAIIPARYLDRAAGFRDSARAAALRSRYELQIATASETDRSSR